MVPLTHPGLLHRQIPSGSNHGSLQCSFAVVSASATNKHLEFPKLAKLLGFCNLTGSRQDADFRCQGSR